MIRILFVDDEPDLLEVGKELLETYPDFTVHTSESAEEALILLKESPFDAIISDYSMPDMDGLTFLNQVRLYYPSLPFIFFTVQMDATIIIQALNKGADFYLQKSTEQGTQFIELAQIIRITVSSDRSARLLKESEEKFRTITEYTYDWIYWIGPDNRLIYISPSCERITGWRKEDFYQDDELFSRIILPEDIPIWEEHYSEESRNYQYFSFEIRIVTKDKAIRWIHHACQPLYNSEGLYLGRRLNNRDITSQKTAEIQLLKERDNFLKIFKAAPIGLILMNENAEILQTNEIVASLVLRDPVDIINKRAGGALGCIHSTENPKGCGYSVACPDCPLRQSIEAVVKERSEIHGKIIPLELLIKGETMKRWLRISVEPVEIEGTNRVIVSIDDITDQRNIEIALAESEEKFRTLADSTTAAIMMYQDNYWIYANPAASTITGYSQEELLSMHFWDLILPSSKDKLKKQGINRQNAQISGAWNDEIQIIRKDRSCAWVEVIANSIKIGTKKAGLVTAIDITERKRAEELLAKSEEKYRSIFENQIDLFYQTDMTDIITELSPSCFELTGWERESLIGTRASELYHDIERKLVFDETLRKNGVVYDFEAELFNARGLPVRVSINSHIIYDEAGEPDHIEGTIRDITERKNAEEALRRSEEHYRNLFENMLNGFAYCRMEYDQNGKPNDFVYIEVNESFGRLTGLADVIGKRVTEVIPGVKEETPELFDIYNRVVVSGEPITFEIDFSPLDLWLYISVYRPEEGHFVTIFDNITKRKQAEIRLHNLVLEQKTILENVPSMIWYKDTNNTYVKVNPAAASVFGRPFEEIEGKKHNELFPDMPAEWYEKDREIMQSGKPLFGVVEKLTTSDGKHLWVQTDKVPLKDEDGTIFGILVVCTDITERKKAKDAVSLANKKLNLLSDITRHDVVNQLQGLFFTLTLAMEKEENLTIQDYLQKVELFAQNIERQMAFTRDYQDIGLTSPTWQNVKETLNKVVMRIESGKIKIRIDLPELEIYADPLLEKVFDNLIDNALRYGEKISEMIIFGREEPEGYTIICADDGVGIPDQFKSGIFNREYFKHTGFGLNLSKEILDMTGVSIRETGEQGVGARFELSVPAENYRLIPK